MSTTYYIPAERRKDQEAITLEKFFQKRDQRRRRVAKRLYKRFPLFAVEMMQEEFPGYTQEMFLDDVLRKGRKGTTYRRPKSPLKRQGRYVLYEQAMSRYFDTQDVAYLQEAQRLRNRLYLPFELVWRVQGVQRWLTLPSTTSVKLVHELSQIKVETIQQLDEILAEKLKYVHLT